MDAALNLEAVRNIILIGPARKWRERFANSKERAYFWHRARETHRFVYGTPFPNWYTPDMWAEKVEKWALEHYLEYFAREGHKPVMFVDGELESQSEKLYLEKHFSLQQHNKDNGQHQLETRKERKLKHKLDLLQIREVGK